MPPCAGVVYIDHLCLSVMSASCILYHYRLKGGGHLCAPTRCCPSRGRRSSDSGGAASERAGGGRSPQQATSLLCVFAGARYTGLFMPSPIASFIACRPHSMQAHMSKVRVDQTAVPMLHCSCSCWRFNLCLHWAWRCLIPLFLRGAFFFLLSSPSSSSASSFPLFCETAGDCLCFCLRDLFRLADQTSSFHLEKVSLMHQTGQLLDPCRTKRLRHHIAHVLVSMNLRKLYVSRLYMFPAPQPVQPEMPHPRVMHIVLEVCYACGRI